MQISDHKAGSHKELLSAYDVRPSKPKGQNFLTDPNIPGKIVRLAKIGSTDGVLEVGPGTGALTAPLCAAAGRVTAVELDERLLPLLRDVFDGVENLDIVRGDIMKLDLAGIVSEKMPGLAHHVCANLPYSITTPVLTLFIKSGLFKTITVMIQKEVAQRICAKPGTPEYGSFTVFANYHTEPELLFYVPPECFEPRPDVHSAVIRMITRESVILAPEEEAHFFKVVRAAFAHRRKTLANALYAVFGNTHSKDSVSEMIRMCGLDERVRGETLGIEEFIRLSKLV